MMRRFSTGVVVALGVMMLMGGRAFTQNVSGPAKAKATTPEIPFDSVPNFFKMPAGLYMGEGVGVATNSKGHIFVYSRSGETRLFEFDQTGAFVKEWAGGSYGVSFAHAVRVDKYDNVWAVDEGSNVIMKFSPDAKLTMVLGKRPDPLEQLALLPGGGQYSGANKPYSFHRETDVAWDPQDNIFVSDGYGDSRVVKYDKTGARHRRRREGHGLRRRPRQLAHRRARQRPEPEGGVRHRRRAVGGLHHEHAASVLVQLQFVPDREQLRPGLDDRRGVQDGAGRHRAGTVRQGRARVQGVQQHPSDGLPQPE